MRNLSPRAPHSTPDSLAVGKTYKSVYAPMPVCALPTRWRRRRECPNEKCKNRNFAKRSECFKCKVAPYRDV